MSDVVVIYGPTGSGKSTLLNSFASEHSDYVQVLVPESPGVDFDGSLVAWKNTVVAIDEVCLWGRQSICEEIPKLVAAAQSLRKKLVLVVQLREDLTDWGIELPSAAVYVEIKRGDPQSKFPIKMVKGYPIASVSQLLNIAATNLEKIDLSKIVYLRFPTKPT